MKGEISVKLSPGLLISVLAVTLVAVLYKKHAVPVGKFRVADIDKLLANSPVKDDSVLRIRMKETWVRRGLMEDDYGSNT